MTPSLLSPYHEGAAQILAGRSTPLETVLLRIHSLNPDLEIPDSPTLNDLASLLRLNERRRAGLRKLRDVPITLLPPDITSQELTEDLLAINFLFTEPELHPNGYSIGLQTEEVNFLYNTNTITPLVFDISELTPSSDYVLAIKTRGNGTSYLDSEITTINFTTP